jgi:hypothetical protein
MPVIQRDPPMASRVALSLLRASRFPRLASAGGWESNAAPEDLMAHPAFVMTATDAAGGASPRAAAEYIGWRYVTQSEFGPAVTTVLEDRLTANHRFSTFDAGPYASAAPLALREQIGTANNQPKDFEVRFLGVPALYLEAIWLRDITSTEDLFSPFGPVPQGLNAGTTYSRDQWQAIVQVLAARVLAISAEFERSGQ